MQQPENSPDNSDKNLCSIYFPHHAPRQIINCVPKERGGINIFVGGRGGHGGTNLDVRVDLKFPFSGK
jgi:hypothetical protein